jgi:hypothetical protein
MSDLKQLTLGKLLVKLEQLKKALSLLNKLSASAYKTMTKSRVFGNMNKVRALIAKKLKGV